MKTSRLFELEAESVFVLREIAALFRNPMLLFSGGKDSAVALHLAKKAVFPGRVSFGLLHIDSGRDFPETCDFIHETAMREGLRLVTVSVQKYLKDHEAELADDLKRNINRLQSYALKEALSKFGFDLLIGGARRDEEKARAKERFFSLRGVDGAWDPESQRSEIGKLFNFHLSAGEHMRAFPLNNWTEDDVWAYIEQEKIALPAIYFSHERNCWRNALGQLVSDSSQLNKNGWTDVGVQRVRCRTVGDMTCTGLIESSAATVREVIEELKGSELSERSSRIDDLFSRAAMEERKLEGYF
jgi:sulfate adenylyltransferase subunit 2